MLGNQIFDRAVQEFRTRVSERLFGHLIYNPNRSLGVDTDDGLRCSLQKSPDGSVVLTKGLLRLALLGDISRRHNSGDDLALAISYRSGIVQDQATFVRTESLDFNQLILDDFSIQERSGHGPLVCLDASSRFW